MPPAFATSAAAPLLDPARLVGWRCVPSLAQRRAAVSGGGASVFPSTRSACAVLQNRGAGEHTHARAATLFAATAAGEERENHTQQDRGEDRSRPSLRRGGWCSAVQRCPSRVREDDASTAEHQTVCQSARGRYNQTPEQSPDNNAQITTSL